MSPWCPLEAEGGILKVWVCLQGWLGEPHESGEDTFLSSREMDRRPLGSSEQFSGIISNDPDFSIMLAGGASRSISSEESEVDAAALSEPKMEANCLKIFFLFFQDFQL